MTWTKLDDGFLEDDVIVELSDRAYRLHVSALVYCNRNLNDGVLLPGTVRVLEAILRFKLKRPIEELVASGLWISRGPSGFRIKNFLKFNPSREEVKARREANAERQRQFRESRNAVTNTVSNGTPTRPGPFSSKDESPPPTAGLELNLWKRLLVATGARDRTSVAKLVRTIKKHGSSERELVCAIDVATGPGIKDPLGAALSELVKLANERRRTA